MKLAVLTDIHGKLKHLRAVEETLRAADYVLLPGDLTMFGKRDEVAKVVEPIRAINPNVLAVMGNCDYPEATAYLEDEGLLLHRKNRAVNGIHFVGLGGSFPCPMPTLNEWSKEQISEYLAEATEGMSEGDPFVLMSHQPPIATTVDRVSSGAHVGSSAVGEFIERRQPIACFSGHIHEAYGRDMLGETILVNPGPFMEGRLAWAEVEHGSVNIEIRNVAGDKHE